MNVLGATVALRERALVDVLDLALRFVVKNAPAFARLSAFVVVPGFLASWLVATRLGWAWGNLACIGLALVAHAPVTALAARRVFDPGARVRDALGESLRTLPSLAGARLLQVLAIGAGLVVVVLPGLWIASAFWFAGEVVILERTNPWRSLGRSSRLFAARGGAAALGPLALGTVQLCAVVLGDVAGGQVLEGLLQFRAPPSIFEEGGSVFGLLGYWVVLPYVGVARLFVYLDVRTRSEGWDVQARFSALRARLLPGEAP